jgi:DNA polymerase-3 subunit gamma/tau
MQNFVVSARKYRPATFDTVVGQAHITGTLKNAIATQHLAQAFLFCGPRGVGKTTCARILAKTINCENLQPDGEACGTCKSCESYQNSNSFNVHELDAASNNSVDDIRNLNEQVRVPPQYGKYKVYIIDEVHMLSTSAFNAFLKTLEEPPKYAIFILATTEKHKILPTILSRCQIFDFNRIKISDISGQLAKVAESEGIKYEEEGLRVIATKADGGMRDALSMFDMVSTFSPDRSITYSQVIANLHILDSDYYFKITQFILEGNSAGLLITFDEILQKGFDGHLFILGLAEHFRDLLLAADPSTHALLEVSEGVASQLMQQSGKASAGFFLNLLNQASQTEIQYKNSKNARLLVELCLLKMANLRHAIEAEAEKKKSELNRKSEVLAFKTPEPVAVIKDKNRLDRGAFKDTPSIRQVPVQPQLSFSQTEKKEEAIPLETEKKILNQALLPEAKEAYINWLKAEQIQQVSAWNLAAKEDIDGLTIYLTFANEIAHGNFEKELVHIKRFFLAHYKNQPSFETLISENEVANLKPYTNAERFAFLAKKYPKLSELRVRLNLEAN